MKRLWPLTLLAIWGCDEPKKAEAPPPAISAEAPALEAAQSKAPLVVPKPQDQGELDQLILAGYTPHGTHLHPPGVKNCPLVKEGNEAVM